MKAVARKDRLSELELLIEMLKKDIDDCVVEDEMHELCDYMLELEERYKSLKGSYYIPKSI